jgi:hypothetical protein
MLNNFCVGEEKVRVNLYRTPVYQKKEKRPINCTHPGCESVFEGYPHTKFCEYHKDIKTREVKKVEKESCIFIFEQATFEKQKIEKDCDCCGKSFVIELYPNIKEYPRFCEDHRSEYKRYFYRSRNGKEINQY